EAAQPSRRALQTTLVSGPNAFIVSSLSWVVLSCSRANAPNAHVERPRRAEASQRSAPTGGQTARRPPTILATSTPPMNAMVQTSRNRVHDSTNGPAGRLSPRTTAQETEHAATAASKARPAVRVAI